MISKLENLEEVLDLYSEYIQYMSRFFPVKDIYEWGRKAIKYLKLYRNTPNFHVYMLREGDEDIGFACVNTYLRFNKEGLSLAEFYISKKSEGQGHGRRLAEYVFSQHPGQWEVVVMHNNPAARDFWAKVIAGYMNDDFSEKQESHYQGYGFVFNNGSSKDSA